MVDTIALFPLNIVAFPGEKINLHIFEPRYKELIKDCLAESGYFGIPSYVKARIDYGTTVRIEKIEKTYQDGRVDIVTWAEKIFRVVDFQNPYPKKLYAKGEIAYQENIFDSDAALQVEMIEKTKELLQLINMISSVTIEYDANTYALAHKVGFSLEQEHELMTKSRESERQKYIVNHLNQLLPSLKEVERLKEKIKSNGHFNNFGPIDF
ncbi:MAG: LON peptidase substrate-binding domain-containing protein [Cyclobacteriaceae bacterium]